MKYLVSENLYEKSFEVCRNYIDEACIWKSKNGERIPAKEKGKVYAWQFYLRKALFNKYFMSTFTHLFVYHVERKLGHFDFQIAGLETAATPMVSALPITCLTMYNIDISGFSVRKEKKEYGLKNWIEGTPLPNKKVMIVDDLSASGNSMEKCHDILYNEGFEFTDIAFSCVDKLYKYEIQKYGNGLNTNDLDQNIEIVSPFTLDNFDLNVA
jgi:orotate phosphoribosyltransferase